MGQIVRASRTQEGTYVIEVKPLPEERVSESEETVLIAGTVGWAERLAGLWHETKEGLFVPLTAIVQIRHKNKKSK